MSFARLEEFIFAKMSETKLPGLSAAIVKGDETEAAIRSRNLECMDWHSLSGRTRRVLPFMQIERALTELVGTYETCKGTMKAQVKRMGDFLTIEIKDKYNELVVPLVPEGIEGEIRTFYTLGSGMKLPVEFRVREAEINLIYERYRLGRIGKI